MAKKRKPSNNRGTASIITLTLVIGLLVLPFEDENANSVRADLMNLFLGIYIGISLPIYK